MPRRKIEINPIRGERLKQIMKSVGVNETTLAELMHYHKGHISFIASGKRNMTEEFAKKVVELFPEYRFEWLMGYDDYETVHEAEIKPALSDFFSKLSKREAVEGLIRTFGISIGGVLGARLGSWTGEKQQEMIEQGMTYEQINEYIHSEIEAQHKLIEDAKNGVNLDSITQASDITDMYDANGSFFITRLSGESLGVVKASEIVKVIDDIVDYTEFKINKMLEGAVDEEEYVRQCIAKRAR